MLLTSSERILVHLHGLVGARLPGRESTQAGIADGAQITRTHVPRALKVLLEEGLVEARDARLPGRPRRMTVYALTPAGVARARELLDALDGQRAVVDGRAMTLREARTALGLTALQALAALDSDGRLAAAPPPMESTTLFQRDEDLGFLRRWRAGPAPVAVVYGSRGMGKTALGRAFAATLTRAAWVDVAACPDLPSLAKAVRDATGVACADPEDPAAVAESLADVFDNGAKLLVLDGYGDVPEGIVDALADFVRVARSRAGAKLLVLAQETTPAYCRFYGKRDADGGAVAERHLRGLDLEGCRAMLGNPTIPDEDLRRIFLLTRGCPLYLQYIREGDEYGLRENSRFTTAEVRLLLYSGRASP